MNRELYDRLVSGMLKRAGGLDDYLAHGRTKYGIPPANRYSGTSARTAPENQGFTIMPSNKMAERQQRDLRSYVADAFGGYDDMTRALGREGPTSTPAARDKDGVLWAVPQGERYNALRSRHEDIARQEDKIKRRQRMDPSKRVFSEADTRNKPEYRRRIWGTLDPKRVNAQTYEDITSGKYNKDAILGYKLPFKIPFTRDQNKIDEENMRRKNEAWTRAAQVVADERRAMEDAAARDDLITSPYNTPVTPNSYFIPSANGMPAEVYSNSKPEKTVYDKYGVPVSTLAHKNMDRLTGGRRLISVRT